MRLIFYGASTLVAGVAVAQDTASVGYYESIIDITTTAASLASTTSTFSSSVVPTSTAPAHYIFAWGDSYTENGFVIGGAKPVQNNPLGNPAYPGTTSTGPGLPNWLDLVTKQGPLNTLTYDFAFGGAAVYNGLTEDANAKVPDFVEQATEFVDNLKPHPAYARWTAQNSIFIVWFGRNDVYWQVVQGANNTRLDQVIGSYFFSLAMLYEAGGRNFLLMGIPPMWREPIWTEAPFSQWAAEIPGDAAYWNANLKGNISDFEQSHAGARLQFFDPQPTILNVLADPQKYGAPNASCSNLNTKGVMTATDCLWANNVHPSEPISRAVGLAVSDLLVNQHFYVSSEDSSSNDQATSTGSSASLSQTLAATGASATMNSSWRFIPGSLWSLLSFIFLWTFVPSALSRF